VKVDLTVLQDLAIALGLGLLVGLQREWVDSRLAGIRTFPIIGILGVLAGDLATSLGPWVVPAGLLAVAALIVMGNVAKLRTGAPDPGLTTEIAILVMYLLGAALSADYTTEVLVAGGTVAVLLHWKRPLHDLVDKIGEADAQAIFRLSLIALVILPVLPNRSFGPYQVLNPFNIWLMVVLIVGISMGAYIAYKLLGTRSGSLVSGLMGGLISSTATTVSLSRRSRTASIESSAAVVIVIASAVVFVRVLFEIALVAPAVLGSTALPLAVMLATMIGMSAVLCRRSLGVLAGPTDEAEPPSELSAAIVFGVLYAAVLLGVAFAKAEFGQTGMYVVAALSGLTDMDAITLSTSQLMRTDQLGPETGWRLIMVGALANLCFKAGLVAALGPRGLLRRIGAAFGVTGAVGIALLFLWPG
jgi:uncharacterized membrane protein (DUF4010 family)